ncbi:MAG: radical SAM protein [Thermoguttaceae bacterium]
MNDYSSILSWLTETDTARLETLWNDADRVRRENVGDEVHMRGLIELSNVCRRQCLYCGVRAGNSELTRYRLTTEEVLNAARDAHRFGYGTVVIQSGEDVAASKDWITELITRIKNETGVAVTLSLGERRCDEWEAWRRAGADRYLLRFETSDPSLFRGIHPPVAGETQQASRLEMLQTLREIGYEIGSGVMSGIPCQTWESLARDIETFRDLHLDMIGCGPFLPHAATPLGRLFDVDPATGLYRPSFPFTQPQRDFCHENGLRIPEPHEQVIPSITLAFKVIALARIVCPWANIPSTTAIASIDAQEGRKLGLARGANVVMPNMTPTKYRSLYAIYPNKAARFESPDETDATAKKQLAAIGRKPIDHSLTLPALNTN